MGRLGTTVASPLSIARSGFYVKKNVDQFGVSGYGVLVEWQVKIFDLDNSFSLASNAFTAKIPGVYTFASNFLFTTIGANERMYVMIWVNGVTVSVASNHSSLDDFIGGIAAVAVQLEAGDVVEVRTYHTNAISKTIYGADGWSQFSGALIGI